MKYTLINGALKSVEESGIHRKLSTTISALVLAFRDVSGSSPLFECLIDIFAAVPPEVIPQIAHGAHVLVTDDHEQVFMSTPVWLEALNKLIYNAFIKPRPPGDAAVSRPAAILLSASLLHLYPNQYPTLLFNGSIFQDTGRDSKPCSYLFVKLLLIDLRTAIPSLQEILNSPEYPLSSARLAASYDLISAFVGFLISGLDDDDNDDNVEGASNVDHNKNSTAASILTPDLLLQLRLDIAEMISLTIEHLRDRYNASVAGAAGLHLSTQASSVDISSSADAALAGTPLTISWDSATASMPNDPLTLSQLRTLALWLREDDNERLRTEAAGIVDVLLGLYVLKDESHEFRSPALIALEGIITTAEGVEAFLVADGWEILVNDLRSILTSGEDAARGIQIVRVLLDVSESEVSGPTRQEWMEVVKLGPATSALAHNEEMKELRTAVWQLSVEILVRAPTGMRRRYGGEARKIWKLARSSAEEARGEGDVDQGVDEVLQGLEGLGFRG